MARAMKMALYDELVPWYRLLDPCEDHRDEAASFEAALLRGIVGEGRALLELGAGAGHNAFHLKRAFTCTLTDVSAPMLALSEEINPECAHRLGDMRTVRLDRTFDAVLVHDAVTYMATEEELLAAARTAFVHTRPGGAAVFAPDSFRETFVEQAQLYEGDDGTRAMRCVEWSWDPDPGDTTCASEYAFLLRHAGQVTAVHDRHVEGLFAKATWIAILSEVGYRVETFARPIGDADETEAFTDEVFLCRR